MPTQEVSFMDTFTGGRINPATLKESDINIKDIAHSLALTCRFRGHCSTFYSVAEHSVRVSNITLKLLIEDKARRFLSTSREYTIGEAEYRTALLALLHDAAEAYTGDHPRGLKSSEQRELESKVQGVIVKRLGLQGAYSEFIKKADNIMLAMEGRDLMPTTAGWYLPESPLEEIIVPLEWRIAEEAFIAKFDSLQSLIISHSKG